MAIFVLLLLFGTTAYAVSAVPPQDFDSDFVWAFSNGNSFRYSAVFGVSDVYPQVFFQIHRLKHHDKYYNEYVTVDGVKVAVGGKFEEQGYRYVPNFRGYLSYRTPNRNTVYKKFQVTDYGYKFFDLHGTIPYRAVKALNLVLNPAPYVTWKHARQSIPNLTTQKLVNHYNGSYTNYFETENGLKFQESRSYNVENGTRVLSIQGVISYVDESGKESSVQYVGEDDRYKLVSPPSVDGLPKPLTDAWEFVSQQQSLLSPNPFSYNPRVIFHSREYNKDGTFTNEYVTDAGLKVTEVGKYEVVDGVKYPVYEGKFTFTDKATGHIYDVKYFFDKDGFQLGGDQSKDAKEFVIPFEVVKAISLTSAAS